MLGADFTFNSIGQAPYVINSGVNTIRITSGPNSGKTLVLFNSSVYSLYDPLTNSYGDDLTLTPINANETKIIPILSGTHAGKSLILTVGSTTTRMYDPVTHSVSAGPTLPEIANSASNYFHVTSGIQSGNIFLYLNTSQTYFYNPDAATITAGHVLTNIGQGFHGFEITSGLNAGKTFVINGDNLTTATSIYDPGSDSFSVGPVTPTTTNYGCNSILLTIGPNAGKQLITRGGGGSEMFLYDHATNSFSSGGTLAIAGGAGLVNTFYTHTSAPYTNQIGLFSAGLVSGVAFSVYDHTANTWSNAGGVEAMTRAIMIPITTGFYTGSFYTLRGGAVGQNTGLNGSDGGRSYVEIDGTIHSTLEVSGGGAAGGNEGDGGDWPMPGIAGGGNYGYPGGANNFVADTIPGTVAMGGYGAYGFFDDDATLKADGFAYNTNPYFGGYPTGPSNSAPSPGGGLYFLSSLFMDYTLAPPVITGWGCGGGGGGKAFGGSGEVTDFDYLQRGNRGGDGYFLLDWSQTDEPWVVF